MKTRATLTRVGLQWAAMCQPLLWSACIFFVTQSAFASSSNTLKNVSFASLPGGRFEVRMDFDGEPAQPAGYEIDKPARIIFDFAGVQNAVTTKKFTLPFDNAQSAVVLGGGDRTRLILNMTTLDLYKTRIEGNSFLIEVGSNKVTETLTKSTTIADKLSSEINQSEASITNVDFRRGENGEGKILVTLSDPSVNVNVEQLSGEIKLSFVGTQLPVNLRRRLDVSDFATPVLAVSSSFDGKDTILSVKPQGDYDYLAYQADNIYVVSVKKLSAQEQEEKKAKFSYVGEKLSLNFQDIPVRSVLQIIADFTELNLVASDSVGGTITLRLDNVPWDQALELVLKTKGLDKRQVGSVLMVAPATELAEQERQLLSTKKQLQELAPLRTEYVQVVYAKAKTIFELFGGKSGDGTSSILSERGSAIVDERTNSIVLTETDEKIQEFRELVKKIDVPVRQVSIEARIVKASTDFSKSLGVRWGMVGSKDDHRKNYGGYTDVKGDGTVYLSGGTDAMLVEHNNNIEINNKTIEAISAVPPTPRKVTLDDIPYDDDKIADALVTDLGAQGFGVDPARFAMGIVTDGFLVTMELSAIQSTGNAELVSQPKVITQDKQKALMKAVEEIPYAVATSAGATAISWRDVGLILEVTPNITPDDHIMLDLDVHKGDRSGTTASGIPIIEDTQLKTNVLVNNGETVVLGGVFEDSNVKSAEKVPFFGDLPLVGRFFRRNTTVSSKTELLIFITPRIVSDPLTNN